MNQHLANGDDESVTITEDHSNFRCRYRSFLRACLAEGITPKEVLAKANYKPNSIRRLLKRMRERHAFKIEFYKNLGGVLKVEPTMLFYANQPATPLDSPAHAFAIRVEKLIEARKIPYFNDETNEPTDVVDFVWQMGDKKLDSLKMTFQEQREGYLLLRDTFMKVVERPLKQGKRKLQIGKMEIGHTLMEDVLADIEVREKMGKIAFDRLEEQYFRNDQHHTERIRETLPDRIRIYTKAVKADALNVDEQGRYLIVEESIRCVLDADSHVRKVIFPTHQQDETFRLYYSRTRSLIDYMLHKRRSLLCKWWPEARDKNTRDLADLSNAWKQNPPDWPSMKLALSRTLDRTRDMIEEIYEGFSEC